ncbi:hypothetical protein [Variovorax sp. dw_954]|uniref:phage fiber-tail adaptor protein n=1 Tax=Variovorax sp. dw_954 TaxID=2720078 RepID=UPI001BD4F726|nr:hypothetical protein [Variovorax sp. dw_954]
MTILAKQRKQPGETLDYDIAYSGSDLPSGDTIVSASATRVCLTDPTDTALDIMSVTFTAKRSKVWLADGTSGKRYKVTVVATSAAGRVFEDEFTIDVRED